MTVTVLYFVTARYADWDAMAFPKTQKYNNLKGSLAGARKDLVLRPTDGPASGKNSALALSYRRCPFSLRCVTLWSGSPEKDRMEIKIFIYNNNKFIDTSN